jgi:hypothetical protein
MIAVQVPKKFKDSSAIYKGVGGFYFLRLICPAITNPRFYGLLTDSPNDDMQRCLILLSKILQNISNGKCYKGLD